MIMVGLTEASERTGVSRHTLRYLIRTGKLSAMRSGASNNGKWLVDLDYLKQALTEESRKNLRQPPNE